jgi:hypothetical protein
MIDNVNAVNSCRRVRHLRLTNFSAERGNEMDVMRVLPHRHHVSPYGVAHRLDVDAMFLQSLCGVAPAKQNTQQ